MRLSNHDLPGSCMKMGKGVPHNAGRLLCFPGSLRPDHWGALTPYVSSASIWTFFSLFTASSFHLG